MMATTCTDMSTSTHSKGLKGRRKDEREPSASFFLTRIVIPKKEANGIFFMEYQQINLDPLV